MSSNISTFPTTLELDFKISQLVTTSVAQASTLSQLSNDVLTITNTFKRRRIYMKRLLLYKAEQLFASKENDYIQMICSIYKMNYNRAEPPDMDKDITPSWLIADAVIAESETQDREAYTAIFVYVYGYTPDSIFGSYDFN